MSAVSIPSIVPCVQTRKEKQQKRYDEGVRIDAVGTVELESVLQVASQSQRRHDSNVGCTSMLNSPTNNDVNYHALTSTGDYIPLL